MTQELPTDFQALVREILESQDTLGSTAAALRALAGRTQWTTFSLVLEVVLPVLSSPRTSERQRLVGLFAISNLYADYPLHVDPFRTTYEAALVRTKWSLQADSETLHASILYILCGFGHLLSAFSIPELFPFPLPVGQAFPRGVSAPVVAVHQEAAPSTPSLPLDQTLRYLSKALESSLNPAEAAHLLQAIPPLKSILPGLLLPADIPLLARQNLDVAHLFLATFFAAPSPQSDAVQLESYAVALADLELGLAGLDLFTRLLVVRDPTKGMEVLAKIVKVEALGPYIARYVDYIDVLASLGGEDDTCARLVRIIALFAITLLDESVLQPLEDATLQLAGFALRHSRFADGQRLYARIVSSQRLLGG